MVKIHLKFCILQIIQKVMSGTHFYDHKTLDYIKVFYIKKLSIMRKRVPKPIEKCENISKFG